MEYALIELAPSEMRTLQAYWLRLKPIKCASSTGTSTCLHEEDFRFNEIWLIASELQLRTQCN